MSEGRSEGRSERSSRDEESRADGCRDGQTDAHTDVDELAVDENERHTKDVTLVTSDYSAFARRRRGRRTEAVSVVGGGLNDDDACEM